MIGKHGFYIKQEKCQFLLPRVQYLGHQISSDGIRQPLTNVEARGVEARGVAASTAGTAMAVQVLDNCHFILDVVPGMS